MALGLIVLMGYFIDFALLGVLRRVFLSWAVVLAAVALLVGIANLLRVHWRRLTRGQTGGFYSLILILSLIGTLVVIGISGGPTSTWSLWVFNYIQTPVESSLMAVLAVVLAYASIRLLRRRANLVSLVFVGTVLLILIGTATLPWFEIPGLGELRSWTAQVPAAAGARGILLGVALGTVATGLRVLMGADRPYGG